MSESKGGMLVYKCRMCAEEFADVHVPDVALAVTYLANGLALPWGNVPVGLLGAHSHKDGLGVADLIGGRRDK